jgi:NDP-sugar pyrophosphorylase family protein
VRSPTNRLLCYVQLGPNVTVGKNVKIGPGVRVSHSIILDDAEIKVSIPLR